MHKIGRTIRRRRKEGKTDYKLRLGLLKSGEPRIVVRKTNRFIIGQIVVSEIAQDKVIGGVNSKELLSKGWPKELEGSLKNLAASYLAGYLLAKKSKDVKKAIFDIGLQRNVKKSRLYAFLKGVVDGGMEIPHNEEALPNEEEIKGSDKTKDLVDKIKGGMK